MFGFKVYRFLGAASLVACAMVFLTASAENIGDVEEVCHEFLTEHPGDPEWENSCLSAMEEYAAANPPAENPDTTPAPEIVRVVPENQIQSTPVPGAGDRDSVASTLRSGASVDVLVEFEVRDIDVESFLRAFDRGASTLGADELAFKRTEYARIKGSAMAGLQDIRILEEYDNLGSSFVRIESEEALNYLLSRQEVRAVHENEALKPHLVQTLPIIGHPSAVAAGQGGAGTTIAVLDSGVDYTLNDFNNCTSPGVPSGCRVLATFEAPGAVDGNPLDDSPDKHGTNVSAIAAAVAGDANLVVADVWSINAQGVENISSPTRIVR